MRTTLKTNSFIFQVLMCRNPRVTRTLVLCHQSAEDPSGSTQYLPHHSQSDQLSDFLPEFQVSEMEVAQISPVLCSIYQAQALLLLSEKLQKRALD